MKKIITAFILLTMLGIFSTFIIQTEKRNEVLKVFTPTKLGIDINKNKTIESNEIFCIENIETFSSEPNTRAFNKYKKQFHLNDTEIISLGYLALDFAQKTLLDKSVIIKTPHKVTSECRYADIKINGISYAELLKNSGYGIVNNRINNKTKFIQNLNVARNLNLVVLNHHSNKYHKLTCKYGKIAHDKILIPLKQIPDGAIPCKYCFNTVKKNKISRYKPLNKNLNSQNLKEPPLTISDGNINIYYLNFTRHLKPNNSCTTNVCKEFINLVDNAENSIDIAIYGYENIDRVTEALVKAKNRGVKIRYIYDENSNGESNYYTCNNIIKQISDQFRSDKSDSVSQSNMLMHNKFVIFDNKIVYTGSMNFSKTGFSGYDYNDVAVINSKEIAQLYTNEFEQMLAGKFHNKKQQNNPANKFQVGNSNIEIYFSPQDKSSLRIVQLIKNAQKYVYVPTFLITHTEISKELIAAHKRGIDIKILMDANNVYTKNTKHQVLRENGIPVKIENYAGKLHSKTMIIDDKYIIMGSMNFSNSGENKNDENTIIITNPRLAQSYKNFFNYLWEIIPDKYLNYNPKAESKESIGSCTDGVDNNFNGKIDKEEELCK